MENKNLLSRIDSFIDSLGQPGLSDQQEAVLLTTDLTNIGGKNYECINSGSDACNGTGDDGNAKCTNLGNCKGGDNSGCKNFIKPNSDCNEPTLG